MRALDLDFQRQRLASPPGWGLLAAGLLLAGAGLLGQAQIATATAEQERELQRLERQLRGGGVSQASLSPAENRAQEANLAEMRRVTAQMNLPWEALLSTLESQRLEDIALLSLTPDARKRQVRISAEARDLAAMLDFHRRLEQSAALRDVSLLNHEIVAQAKGQPIRFNLLATWVVDDAHP
ncbi:pilus assembly protein [Zestomonas carbonaria]|uniref:Pilus assembly protein n=1 Tax=Zestomonas carbonaria TaxID=2762745 RepID=A0A7U7EPW1_9GAMM|nr:pilus assembly protein [Pseudomonas carbonaria]CAD5108983.1 hypothetical protein PSEWESI4_03279 [Pseudomonas carbonaria]